MVLSQLAMSSLALVKENNKRCERYEPYSPLNKPRRFVYFKKTNKQTNKENCLAQDYFKVLHFSVTLSNTKKTEHCMPVL